MSNPSPKSHLYRLAAILIVFFVGAGFVGQWAIPDNWNYDVWYRGDAPEEMKQRPIVYGGIASIDVTGRNESCQTCHADEVTAFENLKHQTLSCESCHGALGDHAVASEKIADASIDRSAQQCLNCHAPLISRPEGFPQFTEYVYMHEGFRETSLCSECHNAHDPTP